MTEPVDTVRILRVFVSSPGDVAEERKLLEEVVERINETDGIDRSIRLELWRWEKNVVPRIGPPPQDVVDGQTLRYDIYLGIMSARFGTPTKEHGSGTEKEFRDAVKNWGSTGRPWILFCFRNNPPLAGKPEEVRQYPRVVTFRDELEKLGIVGSYSAPRGAADGFFERAEQHLRKVAKIIVPLESPSRTGTQPKQARTLQIPTAYRQWLLAQCAEVELLGLKPKEGRAIRLHSVYVPVTTPAGESADPSESSEARLRPDRRKPQLLLDLLDRESLYVPGAPGSGKSTFCRWVAHLACSGSMPDQPIEAPEGYEEKFPSSLANRLPLLVRLREFWSYLPHAPRCREITGAQLQRSLEAWLQSAKPGGLEWADVEAHLAHGSALLLFDGVDEVPLAREETKPASCPRAMLLAGLADALKTWVPRGNRVLLTSRPYGVEVPDAHKLALRSATIDELEDPIRELLVRKWFHVLKAEPAEAEATAKDMIAHLGERPDVTALTGNPMLLTAMCVIYGEGKRLPQDRAELYDRVIDNVLHNRYPGDPVQIAAVRNRLSVGAHGVHDGTGLGEQRTTPRAEATFDELDRMLQAYMDKRSYVEAGFVGAVAAREDLLTRTGLLLPRDGGHAGFYHLSFQEFLAAERIGDLDDERLFDVFVDRGAVPEWQNTLSFLFGTRLVKSTSPERSIRLLERLFEKVSPDEVGLSVVVGDCLQILLGRGIRLRPELEGKFKELCLVAIEQEAAVRARLQLALTLGHLGDSRIVTDLRDRRGYVEIPAGKYRVGDDRREFDLKKGFLIGRYPVTNSQFRLFVEEKGYDESEWWSEEGLDWLKGAGVSEPALWRHGKWNGPNQPVVGVSLWEAETFSHWAGGRLPEEYEWEAAARGPKGLDYPWGDTWKDGICNSYEAGLEMTSPVGMFRGSRSVAFGLEDMAGNVWEWCASLYEPNDAASSTKRRESIFEGWRVLRGGSWNGSRSDARAAYRDYASAFGWCVRPPSPGSPGPWLPRSGNRARSATERFFRERDCAEPFPFASISAAARAAAPARGAAVPTCPHNARG